VGGESAGTALRVVPPLEAGGEGETRGLRAQFFLGGGEIESECYGVDPRMFFCWSWPRRGGPLKEGRCLVVGWLRWPSNISFVTQTNAGFPCFSNPSGEVVETQGNVSPLSTTANRIIIIKPFPV
jgi:hypothetical protein